MSKGSSSSAPPAPDPTATAALQGAANKETAQETARLSRVGQVNPFFNTQFEQTLAPIQEITDSAGVKRFGVNGQTFTSRTDAEFNALSNPAFNQVTTLNPAEQSLLDKQRGISQGLAGLAEGGVGRVEQSLSQPFSTAGLPERQASVSGPGVDIRSVGQNLPGLPGFGGGSAPQASSMGFGEPLPGDQPGTGFQAQGQGGNLDQSFGQERQRLEDALYQRATSRLNPQFEQAQRSLETKLANQGITQGSQAYTDATQNFGMTRNDAYSNAINDAIAAGGNEQSRLFGMALSGRDQMFNQGLADVQQRNQAQNQGFNQNLQNVNLANAARAAGISEQQLLRSIPLNELAALMGQAGGVAMPNIQQAGGVQVAPTDVVGPVNTAYAAQLADFNNRQASSQATQSGLFGLGAAGIGALGSIYG